MARKEEVLRMVIVTAVQEWEEEENQPKRRTVRWWTCPVEEPRVR